MCRPLITSTKASFCKQKNERKTKFKYVDADDIKQALGVKKKKQEKSKEREGERGTRGDKSGTCGGL
jgi:hypothetical protein